MSVRFFLVLSFFSFFLMANPVYGQKEIYRLRWGMDVPIATIGIGTTTASFLLKKNKSPLTESQINSLSALSINRFDRNATKQWNPKIAKKRL